MVIPLARLRIEALLVFRIVSSGLLDRIDRIQRCEDSSKFGDMTELKKEGDENG